MIACSLPLGDTSVQVRLHCAELLVPAASAPQPVGSLEIVCEGETLAHISQVQSAY